MIVLAMVLDALFGEPKWLWNRAPHPAVLMGRAVAALEVRLNDRTRIKGLLAVLILVTGAVVSGGLLDLVLGSWASVIAGAILLAHRSLVQHVQAVANGLRASTDAGRQAVAMIVGRDVSDMDDPAIARAAIESAAENFSDGVIAPLFWFVLTGLPGLIAYKVVNTADSMIGYRTDKYEKFGWGAARLDDLLNWVPARITAALIWIAGGRRGGWRDIAADAARHRSPNAGWPEAAMAPALDVALSGPRSYDGRMQTFAWVHASGRKNATPVDIDASVGVLWTAWIIALGVVIITEFAPFVFWLTASMLAA